MKNSNKEILLNLCLVWGAVFVALLIGELSVRDYHWGFENLILQQGGKLVEHHFRGLYGYDSDLGWVPLPNVSQEKWGGKINTLDDGIRSNGDSGPLKPGTFMAVGCSFTFGDEVPDDQTWPAYLEKLTRRRVLNAGVSSYGLDQSVLRAEKLIPKYHPDVVIISLVYDTIYRMQQSVRNGICKPYFDVVNGQVVVKNQPIPFKPHAQLDWFRSAFGHSYLVHKLMAKWFPKYWWKDTMRDECTVKIDWSKVVPGMLKKLEEDIPPGTRIILLVHDNINLNETRYRIVEMMLPQWRKELKRVEICNLVPAMMILKAQNPQEFESLFLPPNSFRHYSAKGNAWLAFMLSKALSGQQILTP